MISRHFEIHELVPKQLFELLPDELLWQLLDDRLIESIDAVKDKFPNGSMTINNYFWSGKREWSGVRTSDSSYYSPTSQHSINKKKAKGTAIDSVFSAYNIDDVRNYIIANPEEFPYIKGIEMGVSWLHIDVRERDEVLLFNP